MSAPDAAEACSYPPPAAFAREALVRDEAVYAEAAADPVAWWAAQAQALDWATAPQRTLEDDDPPFYRWFVGGTLNAAANCLDRHVAAGRGERVAFHWCGEEGEERVLTYAWLLEQSQRFANALLDRGVRKGDVVGIYLPMIPEILVAMLACARIGAPHNVVFGGFSAEAVRERMAASGAKALVTVDGARRKGATAPVKAVVDAVGMPVEMTFVVPHTGVDCPMGERDVWFDEALAAAAPDCPAEPFDAEHPLFLLYTSGSTGKPKGVVHGTGGYLTGLAWTYRHVFDVRPDSDVWWCTADLGWITGHSYTVYAPLLAGATSVMFEGAPEYPHRGIWWELCERYGVTVFYSAPTAIRAAIKWGEEHVTSRDLSKLRLLATAGEPINPAAWTWYRDVVGGGRCPVVDTWWQTETGHVMISPLPGVTAAKPGSACRAIPGVDVAVLDETGEEVAEGTGTLVVRGAWPGMALGLLGERERFLSTYFSRYGREVYVAGDAARVDEDGYVWIVGRVDDVLNVSGHRMSTAEIESAIVSHPAVAEAAVIGQSDPDSGESVTVFATLRGEREGSAELEAELREHVAVRIGKLARPKRILWADDLPKTRSGKIMRRLLRDLAEGRELGDVTTLRDPDAVSALAARVRDGA